MKIWLMNHYASNMFFDGAGRHFWFAKQLKERGHEPAVFCASSVLNKTESVETGGAVSIEKETDQLPFVFVKVHNYAGNGLDRVRNMLDFYRHLFPAAKRYAKAHGKPDIIIASSVHPLTMVAGIQIAKRMRIPCICEIRDLWPEAIFAFGKAKENSLLGKALIAGEHWIYRRADALIFTKEGDTDYLKERGWTTAQGGDIDLAKCHYINNGIDFSAFAEHILRDTVDDPELDSGFNVTYTGTIRPVNNVGNLLDCAKIIRARGGYDDIRFMIYGEGIELEKLKARVCDEHIENVSLKGFVARKYVPYILSRSAVNVLNYSQSEYNWTRGNSSNKLFEYMASGKPIISTVKMGYSIINRYQCGEELNESTPEALADAIIRMHDMPEKEYVRMGENAKSGARDFDFSVLTEKLLGVIGSVMK